MLVCTIGNFGIAIAVGLGLGIALSGLAAWLILRK